MNPTSSTSYKVDVYYRRLEKSEPPRGLKRAVIEIITKKLTQLNRDSEDQLSYADYREILEEVHKANPAYHDYLNQHDIKTVSKLSWFSNTRATGKVAAIKHHLGIRSPITRAGSKPQQIELTQQVSTNYSKLVSQITPTRITSFNNQPELNNPQVSRFTTNPIKYNSVEEQALEVLEKIKLFLADNPQIQMLGLSYAANGEQIKYMEKIKGEDDHYKLYTSRINGSGQAELIHTMIRCLKHQDFKELSSKLFIIPFDTMSKPKQNETQYEYMEQGIDRLNAFLATPGAHCLLWRTPIHSKSGPMERFALGGGVNASFVDSPADQYVQAALEKITKTEPYPHTGKEIDIPTNKI
jgi:hypothetical protein